MSRQTKILSLKQANDRTYSLIATINDNCSLGICHHQFVCEEWETENEWVWMHIWSNYKERISMHFTHSVQILCKIITNGWTWRIEMGNSYEQQEMHFISVLLFSSSLVFWSYYCYLFGCFLSLVMEYELHIFVEFRMKRSNRHCSLHNIIILQ